MTGATDLHFTRVQVPPDEAASAYPHHAPAPVQMFRREKNNSLLDAEQTRFAQNVKATGTGFAQPLQNLLLRWFFIPHAPQKFGAIRRARNFAAFH